jgi:hypothetical protein
VRVVSWIFVVCAFASATGIFMPSLEVTLVRSKYGSVSLYEIGTHRALATKLIAAYHKSHGRALAESLTGAIVKHSKNEYVGDASDAMSTLDSVSDKDVQTLGTVFVVTIWAFLVLQAVMGLLVLGSLVGDVYRKRRLVAVAAMSLVSTVIAIAMRLVVGEAAFQANDEIGRTVLGVGPGATLMVVAAAIGLVAIVTVTIGRTMRKT